MSLAHRFSVAAIAAALMALHPTVGRAQEQEQPKPAAGQPAAPAPAVVPLAADERRKFVGDYDVSLPDGRILGVRVFAEDDKLMLVPEEQEKSPMRYYGSNTFDLELDPSVRIVFDVAKAKVTGGKVLQRGMTMNMFRRP